MVRDVSKSVLKWPATISFMKKLFICVIFVSLVIILLIKNNYNFQLFWSGINGENNHKFQLFWSGRNAEGPYVLGWDFDESQTCASRNLVSLIHWAGYSNFAVVEPCVKDSYFNLGHCMSTVKSSLNNDSLPLLFRDYFDMDYWNQQILSHKIGQPLVPWEEFINNIPREAIVVYLWRGVKGTKLSSFVDEEIQRDAPGCYEQYVISRPRFNNSILINRFSVKVVREVCFRFNRFVPIEIQWFNRQLLGNYTQSAHIMILFAKWMGTVTSKLFLNYAEIEPKKAFGFIKPSPRIIEHGKKYKELFLGEDNYVAVALRTAKIARHLKHKGKSQAYILHFLIEDCGHQISLALKKFKGKKLLALDIGKFGDGEASEFITNDTVSITVSKLLNIVYGNKWNWTQWEDSFVKATGGITDTGYIAMMQKELVANATCLIIGGNGEFQNTLIKEHNMRTKDHCMHKVCAI